jgi:uncharacterized protein (TIGR02147 family)
MTATSLPLPAGGPESVSPDLYRYDDFRAFLRDAFAYLKQQTPSTTHRSFAQAAGIANVGYLHDVILGKRALSRNQCLKIASAFDLKEAEIDFLWLLAQFGQAKKADDRQRLYDAIRMRRGRSRFARLSPERVKYYQDGLHPLVRCALEVIDFRGDYEALGRFLEPPLPPATVRKLVDDLLEWGLARRQPDGRIKVTETFVEPPPTLGAMVRRLNREWIIQAAEAPFRFAPGDRHVSTLLLMVSDEARDRIRDRLESFRKEILEMVAADQGPRSIMQLSLQYFPKSRRKLMRQGDSSRTRLPRATGGGQG